MFQELIIKDSKVCLTFKPLYSLQFETEVHLVNDLLSILEYYCDLRFLPGQNAHLFERTRGDKNQIFYTWVICENALLKTADVGEFMYISNSGYLINL